MDEEIYEMTLKKVELYRKVLLKGWNPGRVWTLEGLIKYPIFFIKFIYFVTPN